MLVKLAFTPVINVLSFGKEISISINVLIYKTTFKNGNAFCLMKNI